MKLIFEEEILKNMVETFSVAIQKEKVKKKEVDSFKVEKKHIKRKNYKINKRHKQVY